MAEKARVVNPNRFFWNPDTKEKIYTEYMDGTKIALNDGQKEKAKEASKECTDRANRIIESDVNMKRKPKHKRLFGVAKTIEEPKKEESILTKK